MAFAGAAREARAVILYSSPTSNTSPPSDAQGLPAWNLEGTFGAYLATPIDASHFIAAAHIGLAPSITVLDASGQPHTYQVDTSFNGGVGYARDPGSDLCVYQIKGTFPAWAPR
jgi:hypothetical protein